MLNSFISKVLYPAMGILPGGSYSQYTPINKNHVIKVPTNLSLEQVSIVYISISSQDNLPVI